EDRPPGSTCPSNFCHDRDAHANGRVQYTFQNGEDGDGDFTIEPTSGIVRTVRRLDRESVPFYELTAYAVDRGVPPQRTPVHIQVTVLDVNDNAPVFPADDFEVLVKENSAVGSVVAQITATDPDEGANAQIMYQIVEGNIPEIFQMDIFSGELTSLIDLDYEARNEYVIVVQATSAPLVSRATVRIRLVDQNDNRPTLQDFQIIFNNFVSNRSNNAGRLSFSMAPLMNSRSSDYFHIHPDTGLITTTQILDREHMDLHYFRVTATDSGSPRLSGTTMGAITVADRNDHSPNVEEGYPILQLRATDMDSPSNANIRYRFVGDSAAMARAAFEIDPRSGLITTRGAVDRETNEHYTLQVEATDQGKEPSPRSATVKVHITVLDENDNVPQFSEKRYVVAVKEDVRPHSKILRVSATDRDKDNNAAVHYNISGNSRGQFFIDSITGEIQVVAPLDYESEREYALRVRAQDNGRPPLSNNTGIVSIQVTDVNDNPPIFVSTPFQASVLESAPIGSSILHIQAIDTDSGDNARLEYRLTGTSSDTPFVINSATGWVTVKSTLDREAVEHYFFGVEARDYGMPPLSATASVTITVMDVNDNRPEFLQKEYYARLNEDAAVGTSVVTVTAVDRDVNSAVTYQITGGNTRNRFAISTAGSAGLLSLALPLDYKQERRYVLTVTASDRTLHDTCQVHINITDANTHRPVFQSAHYSISVNEDRPPGSTVVVISATDDDVGENARITYYLEDNIPQFRIDPATGAITLQAELDYEDQMTYTLAITAKDNGIPQKSDTTYVEVNVNDVNDNAPQFVSPRYQGTVSEDAPPFTSVLQISATDRDAHANGRVQYTFQNGEDGDGDFTIEPTSGIVRTVRRLDRESVPFYELTAYAVDRGVPPQRTPVHIQVTVLDVNDNAPVFPADDFEVLVKENSAVGSVVAQITATDPDEGANAQIMYQIVEGNIPEIFQMDIFSGELTSFRSRTRGFDEKKDFATNNANPTNISVNGSIICL
uniref:Cadherin, EGF LAG seven-pass G-type receptor 3 n=1 Tax=Sphaeramia orbicularis TaxID=375764 RepID=A0A673AS72_9TELE